MLFLNKAIAREGLPHYVDVRIPITKNWHVALAGTTQRRAISMIDIFALFGVMRHDESTLSIENEGELLVGRLDLNAAINLMAIIVAELDTPTDILTKKLNQYYLSQFDPKDPFARPFSEIVDRQFGKTRKGKKSQPEQSGAAK